MVCITIIHFNMKACEPMDQNESLHYLIQCINDSLLEGPNESLHLIDLNGSHSMQSHVNFHQKRARKRNL